MPSVATLKKQGARPDPPVPVAPGPSCGPVPLCYFTSPVGRGVVDVSAGRIG